MKKQPVNSHIKLSRLLLFLLLFLVAFTRPETSGNIEKILEKFHDANSDYVMVAAHRAAHKDHPENSISSIKRAIELGVDIVELDVKITSDGIPVLMHDGTVDRTTNGSGKVEDYTLSELKAFSLKMPDGTVTSETIPTFEEALKVIHGNIMVDIDLKTDDVLPIVETVKRTGTNSQVFYFDNDYDLLNKILELEENSMIMPRAYSYEMADSALNLFSPQVVHIDPSFYSPEVTHLIAKGNARVWINALGIPDAMIRQGNVEKAMNKLLLYNANIIQTDEPELIIQYLNSKGLRQTTQLPDYKNPDKGVEERVEDLLTRMTLEEKVNIVGGNDNKTMSNPRLGIPEMIMTDGPLGPNAKGHSTNYSAMINFAATFNPDLMYSVAEQIGEETRVMGRNVLLGPNINIARVPHGGRTFEGFGEDPYLVSRMVVPYIKGVQSRNVITCTKHFVANNQEWNRFDVSAEMDERTLREIYFPAFKAAIQEGDTWTIMAAYNMFRGVYACENKYLLTDVLKDDWGFTGIAISDWGGARSTVPMANSGLDLEMPTGKYYGEKLLRAIREGEVSEATLDDKVRRILRVILKAGLFDESVDQYGGHSDQHHRRALALQAARQSIILLKNEHGILPLKKEGIRSIAVIGPNGAEARMEGGGSGGLTGNYGISPYEGIVNKVGDEIAVKFARGIPERSLDLPIAGPQYYTTSEGTPGIRAEFFNNKEQEGKPVHTRVDQDINFNWESASPVPGVVHPDKWSARWNGKFRSPGEGWYEIGLKADNGIRMYIDGKKIIDAWIDGSPGKFKIARFKFEADRHYNIQVDFYENIGTCRCKLGFAPYEPGDMMANAVQLASESEVVILCMGLDKELEGEAVDRARLSLDEDQLQLIDRVLDVNRNVVMVLNNATPILMQEWLDRTPALIEALYPGQEGGTALADILFGDLSPSGKLPLTFPEKWEDSPAYGTYPGKKAVVHHTEGIFVGYRHFDRENIEPLFPFGFGLSYTTFDYSDLKLSQNSITADDSLRVEVTIKNSGTMAGDEIVQLYIHDERSSVERELKSLKGFTRVSLDPGETKHVSFSIDKSHLSFYDINKNRWITESGRFEVLIGSSSRDIRLSQIFKFK